MTGCNVRCTHRAKIIGFKLAAAIMVLAWMTGCAGDPGPMGPAGPAGLAGSEGPAGPGTRTVYSGIVETIASTNGQNVGVPLDLSDFPMVSVYVADSLGDWLQMNLVVYNPATGRYPVFETAVLRTDRVTLFSQQIGHEYKIVVVI